MKDKNEIKRLLSKGLSVGEIANQIPCSRSTVYRLVMGRISTWPSEGRDLEIKKLVQNKVSYEEIGRIYNITRQRVHQIAKKLNVESEYAKEVRAVALGRRLKLIQKRKERIERKTLRLEEIRELVEVQGKSFNEAARILEMPLTNLIYMAAKAKPEIKSIHSSKNPNFRPKKKRV